MCIIIQRDSNNFLFVIFEHIERYIDIAVVLIKPGLYEANKDSLTDADFVRDIYTVQQLFSNCHILSPADNPPSSSSYSLRPCCLVRTHLFYT